MSDTAVATVAPVATDGKIVCHVDNVRVHIIKSHLAQNHPDWTIERYEAEFPGEPLMSPLALELKAKKDAERAANAAAEKANSVAKSARAASIIAEATGMAAPAEIVVKNEFFHEVFELGAAPAALNARGKPIPCDVLSGHDDQAQAYLAEVDRNYIFNIDLLKKIIIGFQLDMPVYLWGMHGTGKTTALKQAAARTRRPFVRVQHTINMQESDVLGQWTVKDGATEFQLGPLPMAMINGWVYCADEYDFAMPSVTSVYQPVLEGEALLIKDAPPMFRKIEPHPHFRFCATGNTNGGGDETGLYQGTLVQNAANYSRFMITEEVHYMEPKMEEAILVSVTRIDKASAAKIVKFANDIRKLFADGKISMTVSPRELISASKIGIAYGGNWALGLELAFANRISRIDRRVVQEYLQRIMGS